MANPESNPVTNESYYGSVQGFSIVHTPICLDAAIVVPAMRSAEFPPLGASRSYQPVFFLDLPGEVRTYTLS